MRFKLACIILFLSLTVSAQDINSKKLDSYLNHIEKYNQGIGAISIFKNGEEVYKRNFGQHSLPNLEWNQHTKYQVGSITKVVTAVLIWKLIEEGKLSLDDKLSEFYPQIGNAEKINIKNLLEHSSGLKDYLKKTDSLDWIIGKQVTDEAIIKEITLQGTAFEPGTNIKYSNSGYYLLKNIVEKKYAAKYGDIIKKEIISPNNLTDFASSDMNPTNIFNSYAYNYSDTAWKTMEDLYYKNVIGVGDIATTPIQLNKFFFNLFQGKIVNQESLQQMIPTDREDFGRNLQSIPFNEKIFYGHCGDTRGTHSFAMYDIENKINIAITINGELYEQNDFYIGVLKTIYSDETDLPYFPQKADLEKYTGLFTSNEYKVKLKIYIDENLGLMCEDMNAEVAYPLLPYEDSKFKLEEWSIDMEFKPTEMLFKQNGLKITLAKA